MVEGHHFIEMQAVGVDCLVVLRVVDVEFCGVDANDGTWSCQLFIAWEVEVGFGNRIYCGGIEGGM